MRIKLVEAISKDGRFSVTPPIELKANRIYWIMEHGKNINRVIIYEDVPFIKFLFRKIIKKFKGA